MGIRVIPFTTLANGSDLNLYIHEIKGKKGDGPTVGICAAIHGDESAGTKTVMDIYRELKDGDFKGRLLLLPVASPLSFAALQRSTPDLHLDPSNMNRVFPGNENGSLSEQLAALITKTFLQEIDVFIDLHAGGRCQTVDYIYIINDQDLSRHFGSRILYRVNKAYAGTYFQGTVSNVIIERNVPMVTVELGGGLLDQRPYEQRCKQGVLNMLRHLNVLDGEAVLPEEQIIVESITTLKPHFGGILETEAPPLGEKIAGGEVLGRVISPYTFQELEVLTNPVKNGIMILSHLTRDVIHVGDYGYMIGDLETGERIGGGK